MSEAPDSFINELKPLHFTSLQDGDVEAIRKEIEENGGCDLNVGQVELSQHLAILAQCDTTTVNKLSTTDPNVELLRYERRLGTSDYYLHILRNRQMIPANEINPDLDFLNVQIAEIDRALRELTSQRNVAEYVRVQRRSALLDERRQYMTLANAQQGYIEILSCGITKTPLNHST